VQHVFLTFHPDDAAEYQHEEMTEVPAPGTFVWHGGHAYAVSHVWFIEEKHGAMVFGWNVFLKRSHEGYELLKAFDPAYYR
jgi:hypothetical protein